jgi:L-threonylcarbamoyladenylate synthase
VGTDIEAAVACLKAGQLVAFPTETVYGLGADALNPAAVRRIFEVKGRPANHPLIVHIGSATDLEAYAIRVPELAWSLAQRFWPGALTLVLWRHPRVPLLVTGGHDTLALRVPAHPVAQALLQGLEGGIAAPSANRFGRVSPTRAEDVVADLGDDVDYILDGGACTIGVESTILDLTALEPVILRPGGVSREALEEATGLEIGVMGESDVKSPGQLPSHYAPLAQVELCIPQELAEVARDYQREGYRVGVVALEPPGRLPPGVEVISLGNDLHEAARQLYSALREADLRGWDMVLATLPPEVDIGLALADRLRKAAGPRFALE